MSKRSENKIWLCEAKHIGFINLNIIAMNKNKQHIINIEDFVRIVVDFQNENVKKKDV